MARHQRDREDLLKEATALVRRMELRVDSVGSPVVVGFRSNSAPSFYLGLERVYQFTADGMLRRAYVDGQIVKADSHALVALTRHRHAGQLQLIRHELSSSETAELIAEMTRSLIALRQTLQQGRFEIVGQVPEQVDLVSEVVRSIELVTAGPRIALSPNV